MCQMIDANQRWDVAEAIRWVSSLADFKPLWIEEPTCPDDILGHAAISKVRERLIFLTVTLSTELHKEAAFLLQALAPLGIGVASGEQVREVLHHAVWN